MASAVRDRLQRAADDYQHSRASDRTVAAQPGFAAPHGVVVVTERTVQGIKVVEAAGLIHARGVRYGTVRRFAPAEPASPGQERADGTRRGPACPQLPSRLDTVNGPVVDELASDEDCLVLSVVAPADADGLPVMVWFHGGAYMTGSGEAVKYDTDALVREGHVVVVNVSYRLGIFGYLTPDGIDEDNLGLRDQILALRWVRDNIAQFGGASGRVTIFGQSAGGDSVLSLMLCPETEGLFRRAIMQSAPLGVRDGRGAMTASQRGVVTDALGPTPRAASVEQMLSAQAAAIHAAASFGAVSGLPFAPILGRAPLPDAAEVPARIAEIAPRIELLIGYTKNDAAPFVAMRPAARSLDRLGVLGKIILRIVTGAATRKIFGRPARRLADDWARHGGHVATYRFDWAPEDAPFGACHCIDLPNLFGAPADWADAPMLGPTRAIDAELATRVRRCWTGFAHAGITVLKRRTLRFDVK